ncbi:dihydrodipicolinate synthase family protein [Kribbella turkmenica]|uniref:dihydrodipicolinate synthase family protein n=1 Tax=Kribbella turkmenica TaxID=2530375 RepID=UPI0014048BEB|nr:dihydrodipicolinate synthase family protein [Kribbella turkmenica]
MSPTVEGLVPILATPVRPDGGLDLCTLRRLTEFGLASGVSEIAVLGMASEAFALTAAERRVVTEEVARVVSGARIGDCRRSSDLSRHRRAASSRRDRCRR